MAATFRAEEQRLIFIPGPGMGHIVPAVEVAKLILSRTTRLSFTFLLINDPQVHKYKQTLHFDENPRLHFIDLPEVDAPTYSNSNQTPKPPPVVAAEQIDKHKPNVRDAFLDITEKSKARVIGLIVDMFCVSMIDVANEFEIPTYTFYTSSAAFLSLKLHVLSLGDDHGQEITELKFSDRELSIPGFVNPVPAKVLPFEMVDKNGCSALVMSIARKIRQTRGIVINTFQALETTAIEALSDRNRKIPPIYPIGPILNLNLKPPNDENSSIISWLDEQPPSSVVFLCFGSQGSFSDVQIRHVATALESSGHRFLWSVRRRITTDDETGYANVDEVMPEGFLNRTSCVGKVIGWAPQAAAFQAAVELGVAVEVGFDGGDGEVVVGSEEIERAIKRVMEDEEVRRKVKEMREESLRTLMEGGSSCNSLTTLIHDVLCKVDLS